MFCKTSDFISGYDSDSSVWSVNPDELRWKRGKFGINEWEKVYFFLGKGKLTGWERLLQTIDNYSHPVSSPFPIGLNGIINARKLKNIAFNCIFFRFFEWFECRKVFYSQLSLLLNLKNRTFCIKLKFTLTIAI